MAWLVGVSLRHRWIVVGSVVAATLIGVAHLRRAPFDVFPEFAPPRVEIQTEAPGLSTEEVEALITAPLEQGLSGLAWATTIRSKSVSGLSSVELLFEMGTDLLRARQLVQERLALAAAPLPAAARAPVMMPAVSSVSRAMAIGIRSRTLSIMDLTELARWTIRPRLMAMRGVANVAIWGARDRQYQVLVDPTRLQIAGVTMDAVARAAGDATAVGGGGFFDLPNQRLPVRHVAAVTSASDLAQSIVTMRGSAPVRLGDVAEVRLGSPTPIGDAVVDDGPGLLLIVEKEPWGNTLDVTRAVDAALTDLAPALAGVDVDATIFRPATFVMRALDGLRSALVLGCLLVAAVLLMFFAEWRAALISAVSIPLSLLAAGLALTAFGGTIDTMALAGMAIAVGVVVDDAIVDVENVARRLHESAVGHDEARAALDIVWAASLEVRSAVVLASAIVMAVLIPAFFLPGVAGAFFRPLAASYVLAILASMVVALTVTPALSLLLLPPMAKRPRSPLARAFERVYRRLLPSLVAHPRVAIACSAVAVALSLLVVPFLGEEFLPSFQETDFLMHWVGKPGTSLEAMRRVTERVSAELRAIPGVRNFGAHLGRAEAADEVVGQNFAELWTSIEPTAHYATTVERIRAVIDGYPGLHRDVLTYLRERIAEVLTGAGATIVVRTFGPDMDVLRAKSREVATVLERVPGVTALRTEPSVLVPHVAVRWRPDAASIFGVTPGQVRHTVTALVQGLAVGEIYDHQRALPVVLLGTPALRSDPWGLGDVLVDAPDGTQVPLRDVAEIAVEPTPNEIRHDGGSRRLDVTCNVAGRDLGSVTREVDEAVRSVTFPPGYHPEVLGELAARQESQRRMLLLAGMALLAIVGLLHMEFQSWRLTGLVLSTLPFAAVGGMVGVVLGGGVLSLGSLVGFVTVTGIAARNAIMLLSHYRHLETVEGMPFGRELVVRGAVERLAPILMTALCAGVGLLPLIVGGNGPGREIEFPMATVILGGLGTSTTLNLLLMPALYAHFGRRAHAAFTEASDLD
ncbi:MAG: efflux RND transporter permease subunit [bacterium]|nr:efflux RND transporter permease subunit [bacterium]